jgi:DNA-directed RNA polymerase subunit RPC12/RpoP
MKRKIEKVESVSSFLAPGETWNATLECGHLVVLKARPDDLDGDKYIDCEECAGGDMSECPAVGVLGVHVWDDEVEPDHCVNCGKSYGGGSDEAQAQAE